MILYHASLIEITKFDLSKGCHFGGKHSAFEAALRKGSLGLNFQIYLHKVFVPDSLLKIYDAFDVGSAENWKDLIAFVKERGYNSISYKNKYEPSSYPSFVLLADLEEKIVLQSVSIFNSADVDKLFAEGEEE